MLENSSRPRQACGAKRAAEGAVITVLLRYKRDGSKRKMYARKMYKSIRQVRVLQILYNKAVGTFVIL